MEGVAGPLSVSGLSSTGRLLVLLWVLQILRHTGRSRALEPQWMDRNPASQDEQGHWTVCPRAGVGRRPAGAPLQGEKGRLMGRM